MSSTGGPDGSPERDADATGPDRRQFLRAAAATAGVASLAGCSVRLGDSEFGFDFDDGSPAPGTSGSPEGVRGGGTLVYGVPGEPDGANPLTTNSTYSRVALDLVYAGGVRYDPVTFEPRPHVWSDWTVVPGGSTDVYWNVRDGLRWNDGTELTVDDVLFSYEYVIESATGAGRVARESIDVVEESDRSEWDVHARLTEPPVEWEMQLLGLPLLPESQWRGRDPGSFDPTSTDAGPVGLGPGRLTTFRTNRMGVEFSNDHYPETLGSLDWVRDHDALVAGGPFLDAVEFRVFDDEATMTRAFLDGEVDTFYGALAADDVGRVEDADGRDIVDGIGSGFTYFGFNVRRSPVDDLSFRQALAFCFDETFLLDQLGDRRAVAGDVPHSVGYRGSRPETVFGGEPGADPALDAFSFREGSGSSPDVEAVRTFLTRGACIDGSAGTYAGQSYPGSLSGASTTLSGAMHDYAFGEVNSSVLLDHGADAELYMNGQRIPEVLGRPLAVLVGPREETPERHRATVDWVSNLRDLGVPVELVDRPFTERHDLVFRDEDFDVYTAGWGGIGPLGGSLPDLFHSSNADDHRDGGNSSRVDNNPTGYGLYDYATADALLERLENAVEPRRRAELAATAMEAVYLDCPVYVTHTEGLPVPLNTAEWTGFVDGVVDPVGRTWETQVENLRRVE